MKKINKIKKHLARLIKQKRERPKSEMKIRNEKGVVSTDTTEIQGIIRYYWGRRAVPRWWRNRMGRPLFLPQIYQKIICIRSNFHKTTFESW